MKKEKYIHSKEAHAKETQDSNAIKSEVFHVMMAWMQLTLY